MTRAKDKSSIRTLVRGYKTILIGATLFLAGIPLYSTGLDLIEAKSVCAYKGGKFPPGSGVFVPGTTYEETCSVQRDYDQDLTFWAQLISRTGEPIPIPTRIEIRDPNNATIVSEQFSQGLIIVYVKPDVFGTYTAKITSLEDSDNRISQGTSTIYYAFGFLTSNGYEGVNNPTGTAIEVMIVSGNIMIIAGIAILIVGAVQRHRHR